MYSRNMNERQGFTVPPGYDGSRFRRRRHHGNEGTDEVILIPDSDFAPTEEHGDPRNGELSVGGIPTQRGRQYSAIAETDPVEEEVTHHESDHSKEASASAEKRDRLSSILEKFGFGNGFTSDELLLLAVIFLLASDSEDCGDVLLILALLLGLR